MADYKEMLKTVVQDIIHDRMDQAEVSIHQYLVQKTQDVSGLAATPALEDDSNND
jgi:hypothetical protein